MLLAINTRIINKNEQINTLAFAQGWENIDPSPTELAVLINAGYAICPQVRDGYRDAEHFVLSGFIALDMDKEMTIEEALDVPSRMIPW